MSKQIQELATTMPVAIRNLTDFLGWALDQKDHGITQAQLGLLELLSQNADPVQCVLAEQMGIDKSAILRQVDVLELKGCLERRMDPNDRRRKHLVLSRTGKALMTKVMKQRDAELAKAASGIPVEDIEVCTRVLRQLGEWAGNELAKGKLSPRT